MQIFLLLALTSYCRFCDVPILGRVCEYVIDVSFINGHSTVMYSLYFYQIWASAIIIGPWDIQKTKQNKNKQTKTPSQPPNNFSDKYENSAIMNKPYS